MSTLHRVDGGEAKGIPRQDPGSPPDDRVSVPGYGRGPALGSGKDRRRGGPAHRSQGTRDRSTMRSGDREGRVRRKGRGFSRVVEKATDPISLNPPPCRTTRTARAVDLPQRAGSMGIVWFPDGALLSRRIPMGYEDELSTMVLPIIESRGLGFGVRGGPSRIRSGAAARIRGGIMKQDPIPEISVGRPARAPTGAEKARGGRP
jgi:hypothetical protein